MKRLKSKKLFILIILLVLGGGSFGIYKKKQAENLDESLELSRVLDSLGIPSGKSEQIKQEFVDSLQLDTSLRIDKDRENIADKKADSQAIKVMNEIVSGSQHAENKLVTGNLRFWQPQKVAFGFREAKGLKGFVEYRVFYGDSTKINELKKWESSLGVAMGNIFYLSDRNQWNLPHLTGLILKKFNEILPEKWISSVEIIHIELSPVENDNKNPE